MIQQWQEIGGVSCKYDSGPRFCLYLQIWFLSRVLTSTAPLFEQRVDVDSLLFNVLKLTLLRLPSRLRWKWRKTWRHHEPIMVPYTSQSFSSTSAASTSQLNVYMYLPRITDFIGFSFFGGISYQSHSPFLCLVTGCCQPCQPQHHPYWHGWGQLVLAWIPPWLSLQAFSSLLSPPPSSTSLPLYWNTILYTHTDDRVSLETNYKQLQFTSPSWWCILHCGYRWIHELITQWSGCSLKGLEENSVETMGSVQWFPLWSFLQECRRCWPFPFQNLPDGTEWCRTNRCDLDINDETEIKCDFCLIYVCYVPIFFVNL